MESVIKKVYPELPDARFFDLPKKIYANLNYFPQEANEYAVKKLLDLECEGYTIYFYYIPEKVRLVGIFPSKGDVCNFGFWETINDQEVNEKIFEAFHSDAINKGFKTIEGPFHFNTPYRYRLRLTTPKWGMFDNEPVNPEYYIDLIERCGYEPNAVYESHMVNGKDWSDIYAFFKNNPLSQKIDSFNFSFLPCTKEIWKEREKEIHSLLLTTFEKNHRFKGLSFEKFKILFDSQYIDKLCPHCSSFLINKDNGKLIAFAFNFPDYSQLNVTDSKISYQKHYSSLSPKTILIKTTGVHPDHWSQGIYTSLSGYTLGPISKHYDQMIACLMYEKNRSLRITSFLPGVKSHVKCQYALYQRNI